MVRVKRALCIIMLVACAATTQAAGTSRAWRMEPSGRMWAKMYVPHSPEYYTDLGAEILAQVHSPRRLSFLLFLQFRVNSGYVPDPQGQHIDPNYQYYTQGLGLSYNARVPLHIFLHRDCNHMIDIADNRSEYWTALVFGVGTLPFYSSSPFLPLRKSRHLLFRYFLGGGPVLKDTPVVIFDFNNPVTSESFANALLTWPRWRHASLDLLFESGLQTTRPGTKWHGHIATELGFTLHAGRGGWRFFVGRRWRDTRWLRPIDQRSYWGLSFVF
jgi:hypothetical protein